MTSSDDQTALLLSCLQRFEEQSREISHHNDLVELFCRDVLPFLEENKAIEGLRNVWRATRGQLDQKVIETEKRALEETKNTFKELQEAVEDSNHELIMQRISHIENLVTGQKKQYGSPLYRILYDELKWLLQLLLEAGYVDICKKHAKMAIRQVYHQRDTNQQERLVYLHESGRTSHFFSLEEIEKLRENDMLEPSPASTDVELRNEIYVEEFTFAPSVIDAYDAVDAISWNRRRDPSVVWWYFEAALWCWRTPELYFDQVVSPKNRNDHGKHFLTICQKMAWREIASVRDHCELESEPLIFAKNLFQIGLNTLVNAITVYFAQGNGLQERIVPIDTQSMTSFELQLDGNELWVKVSFENQDTEKFFIQKFNETAGAKGSAPFEFVRWLINNPEAGEKTAPLSEKWESTCKHIYRLQLPKVLKAAFFGKTYGSSFQFNGIMTRLSSNVEKILKELRKRHLQRYLGRVEEVPSV
jgi:hypothetical protein